MSLSESSERRAIRDGKDIKTFVDGDDRYLQAIVIVDGDGDQAGITGNPVSVTEGGSAALLTELQLKADLTETQPVLVASALPAGANAIGKLAANSGVDIGDVDVTSIVSIDLADADPYTTPTHTAVNVTTSSASVLAANANRLYAILINDSDTVVYIKLGAAAVANQGIRINAQGGSYEMSAMLGNLYTGAIYAIHAGTGNKVLMMTEGV